MVGARRQYTFAFESGTRRASTRTRGPCPGSPDPDAGPDPCMPTGRHGSSTAEVPTRHETLTLNVQIVMRMSLGSGRSPPGVVTAPAGPNGRAAGTQAVDQ